MKTLVENNCGQDLTKYIILVAFNVWQLGAGTLVLIDDVVVNDMWVPRTNRV
jgi:hypothetical protein